MKKKGCKEMDATRLFLKRKDNIEKIWETLNNLKSLATQMGYPVIDLMLENTLRYKVDILAVGAHALDYAKVQNIASSYLTIGADGECYQWNDLKFGNEELTKMPFVNSAEIMRFISGFENAGFFSEADLTAFKTKFDRAIKNNLNTNFSNQFTMNR